MWPIKIKTIFFFLSFLAYKKEVNEQGGQLQAIVRAHIGETKTKKRLVGQSEIISGLYSLSAHKTMRKELF